MAPRPRRRSRDGQLDAQGTRARLSQRNSGTAIPASSHGWKAPPMMRRGPYATPAAFRRALTDKLREKARTSRWTLAQLQRQMAYDRLLERLYYVDGRWIIKGATALLARDIAVRGTVRVHV